MLFLRLEAGLELARARLTLRESTLTAVRARWGEPGPEISNYSSDQIKRVQEISRTVQAVAGRLPWTCSCLVQSTSLLCMLKRRNLPGALKIGAAKGNKGIKAHAWVVCGDEVILDTAANEAYIQFDQG